MRKDVPFPPVHALALGDFEPAADLLKSLGHPQRLMLVCALIDGERAVSELERELAIRQPSLSQHLGILRDAGIIASRRRAKSVIYKLIDARVASIIEALKSAFAASAKVAGPVEKAMAAPTNGVPMRREAAADPRARGEAAFFGRVRPRELA